MARKLPSDAFDFYVSLAAERSYDQVAKRFGVTKRTVTTAAKRQNWQGRLQAIETKAREAADQKAVETIEAMKERHLKVYRAIQGKAIETLRTMPLATAMDAVRALGMALEGEQLIRGEPTGRLALNVETLIKREYQLMMVADNSKDDWEQFDAK